MATLALAFHPPAVHQLTAPPLGRMQAPGDDSEVYIVPRAIYRDPFRGGDNILVL